MSLSSLTLATLRRYWAERLGVLVSAFEKTGTIIGTAEEDGIHLFRQEELLILTSHPSHLEAVDRHSPELEALNFDSRAEIREWFDSFVSLDKLLGPAFYGYTDSAAFAPVNSDARLLEPADEAAYDAFHAAIPDDEWDAGGPPLTPETVGLFAHEMLVAVAGYDVWDDCIAHISVVTHPDYRNEGNGRAVVSRVTERALSAELIPQYRTLDAWPWSVALAQHLGFERFATSYFGRFDE